MSSAFENAHDFTIREIKFDINNYYGHAGGGSKAAALESEFVRHPGWKLT
jgi:hypothetical protein